MQVLILQYVTEVTTAECDVEHESCCRTRDAARAGGYCTYPSDLSSSTASGGSSTASPPPPAAPAESRSSSARNAATSAGEPAARSRRSPGSPRRSKSCGGAFAVSTSFIGQRRMARRSGPWSAPCAINVRRPGGSAPRRLRSSDFPVTWGGTSSPTAASTVGATSSRLTRSEEHTSELQSLAYLVCRLLLEKKKK